MALPDVAPISGRSDAVVAALSAGPPAPAVAPAPLVVAEQVASSVVGVVQPAGGLVSPTEVVPEGVVQSVPPKT